MLILTIRTDKPEAEIGLFDNEKKLAYVKWQAHRQLSETIHKQVQTCLDGLNKDWPDIKGLVYYAGPGSFTGLRIGAAVANGLRGSLDLNLVTVSGEDWLQVGLNRLQKGEDEMAIPNYGSEAKTTVQKR